MARLARQSANAFQGGRGGRSVADEDPAPGVIRRDASVGIKNGLLTRLLRPIVAPGLPSEVLLRCVADAEARLSSQEFSVLQVRAVLPLNHAQWGISCGPKRSSGRRQPLAQAIFHGFNTQSNSERPMRPARVSSLDARCPRIPIAKRRRATLSITLTVSMAIW